jgi:ABC-type nitrate/sulfonate/bicarbonate transport system substrate-binding protein
MKIRPIVFVLRQFATSTAAAAPLAKGHDLRLASERDGVLYVAQDLGLFKKYGVDLSFVQVRNGPVAMSALSSGETQFHWGSVSGANLGAIAEGADLIFIAGFINRLSGMFMVNPQIKTPAELKGRSVAVNSLSGGGWIFSMLMLDYWGLVPERDRIQFRTLGEQAVMAQGVMSGSADAAFWLHLRKDASEQRIPHARDSEKLPIPYQGSGVITKRSFMASSSATVENVLRALLESSAYIRNPENKGQVMKSLAKALRFRRVEEAEEGYLSMVNLYERKIFPAGRRYPQRHPSARREQRKDPPFEGGGFSRRQRC